VHFVFYMIFFGFIGALLSSWLPVGIGAFLFFTNDQFIKWVLEKTGIRLVPGALASEFVSAFVFMIGLLVLLTYWKGSAPAWLSPWLPPVVSWSFIAAIALVCAVVRIISATVMRKLLPWVGFKITPNSAAWVITEGLVVLGMLGLLLLLISTSTVGGWLGGYLSTPASK
jgi:hypothetical protein